MLIYLWMRFTFRPFVAPVHERDWSWARGVDLRLRGRAHRHIRLPRRGPGLLLLAQTSHRFISLRLGYNCNCKSKKSKPVLSGDRWNPIPIPIHWEGWHQILMALGWHQVPSCQNCIVMGYQMPRFSLVFVSLDPDTDTDSMARLASGLIVSVLHQHRLTSKNVST